MNTKSIYSSCRSLAAVGGLVALAVLLLTWLPAQESPPVAAQEASVLFNGALQDIKEGQYALARIKCGDILRHYPDHPVARQAPLVQAYTLYRLEEYALASRKCDEFLKSGADATLNGYARYLAAKILFRQGKKDESLKQLADLLASGADPALAERVRGLFRNVTFTGQADEDAGLISRLFGGSGAASADAADGDAVRIGLLCPLTGEWSSVGESFMNGAVFRTTRYNNDGKGKKIQLIVEDTRSDLLTTVEGTRRLIEKENVQAIVGPLMSNTTIAAAGLAQTCGVPLVSPTASQYGIAEIGNHIFQANVPARIQGRRMAEFAVTELGFRTFAILAPFDTYGKGIALGFEERINELEDATLVGREWYYEGASDFSAQFGKIRRRELIKTLNLMDVDEDTDVEELARGEDNPDTKMLVPIQSIDALFIPSYADEVPLVASQVAFNNIEAVVLGGDKWNTKDILKSKKYLTGTVFPCIIRRDRTSSDFLAFTRKYRAAHNDATADDIALLAYDGMGMVTQAVGEGAKNRKNISKTLSRIRTFEGVTRNLEFAEGTRYNSHLEFMMIREGRIVPYDPIKYKQE